MASKLRFDLGYLLVGVRIRLRALLDLYREQLLLDLPQKGLVRLETGLVRFGKINLFLV